MQNRIFLSTGDFFNPNDLDYAVQIVAFDSGGIAFTGNELLQIELDTCAGASVDSSQFTCRVLDAASAGANPVSVAGVTCSCRLTLRTIAPEQNNAGLFIEIDTGKPVIPGLPIGRQAGA